MHGVGDAYKLSKIVCILTVTELGYLGGSTDGTAYYNLEGLFIGS